MKLLGNEFRFRFDFIILLCPTFIHNETGRDFAENDPDFISKKDQIDDCLRWMRCALEGTKTLIILDDSADSKDVKQRMNELVNFVFSARHLGIA